MPLALTRAVPAFCLPSMVGMSISAPHSVPIPYQQADQEDLQNVCLSYTDHVSRSGLRKASALTLQATRYSDHKVNNLDIWQRVEGHEILQLSII